ncbi:hypothetical protein Cni_G04876 [Canna indica]|uniref:Uncharacterized protein n=1 Tax=Canna indica TaxID=4628 RepID=A0AAQ3JTS3_9LILI|nr:hypothetical protein Cni_G04876 [Canna indica]
MFWNPQSLLYFFYGAASGVTFFNDPNVSIKYPPSVPNYIVPEEVYSTARSMEPNAHGFFMWMLGFTTLVFDVYLNNLTAQWAADVIGWSKRIGAPVYKDYVVITMGIGQWADGFEWDGGVQAEWDGGVRVYKD